MKWTIVQMAEDWAGIYDGDALQDQGHDWVDVEAAVLSLKRFGVPVPEIEFVEAWDWNTGVSLVPGRSLPASLAEVRRYMADASANQFT